MKLYDRYTRRTIMSIQSMPKDIDLGRYCDEKGLDITSSIFDAGLDRLIHQELLDESNQSKHALFVDLDKKVKIRKDNSFDLFPLVQSIEDKLVMSEFESYLYENVSHLEEICRQPHFLLQRTIEKVNVSRAKRIPSKSYQYLASHTEDWQQKSIVAFKPSRVLNEEMDLNFDIYENQLTLALVERCLRHLRTRLKDCKEISKFMEEYGRLLDKRDDGNVWYEKVQRNLSLIGGVYDDENYSGHNAENQHKMATTEEKLRGVYKRLLAVRSSGLFDEVNIRTAKNITLRNTNVLVNHKHYKYVRQLWTELNKIHPEKTEEDIIEEEQDIMNGLRSYAQVLFAYTAKNCLHYELDGNYSDWSSIHERYSSISFHVSEDKTFEVSVGGKDLRFVVVGNPTSVDFSMLPSRTYFLCYSTEPIQGDTRLIRIDPMDCDSAERIGALLRKYLLAEYASLIKEEFRFEQSLRDFVSYIDAPWLRFDTRPGHYSYSFLSPAKQIDRRRLSSNLVVGRDIRDDQKKSLMALLDDISNNYRRYFDERVYCFHCLAPYNERILESFNYMECETDAFVLDLSQDDRIVLKNVDERFDGLEIDWGYDCLDFRISEL